MTTIINDNFEIQYTPARIVDEKELYIIFYALHPIENKNKRVLKRYNHLRGKMNKTDLIRHLRRIANDINVNLASGKNPFIQVEIPKSYCQLTEAIDLFLKMKARDMRPDGLRLYTSYCTKMKNWLIARKMGDAFVATFTPEQAVEFRNEISLNTKLNNKRYNRLKRFLRN